MPNFMMVVMIAVIGVVDIVAILALCLLKKGRERAALLPSATAIALIAPLCAVAVASFSSMRGFGAIASSSIWSAQNMASETVRSLAVLVAGLLSLAAGLSVFALLLLPAFWDRNQGSGRARKPASVRRMVALTALSMLAVALVAAPFEYVRQTFCITTWVLTATDKDAAQAPPYMSGDKDDYSGVGSISRVSERVATGMILGQIGSIAVVVMLVAIAAAGALLAWPIRVSRAMSALCLGWLCLLIVLWTLPLLPLSKEIQRLRQFAAQTEHMPAAQ